MPLIDLSHVPAPGRGVALGARPLEKAEQGESADTWEGRRGEAKTQPETSVDSAQ